MDTSKMTEFEFSKVKAQMFKEAQNAASWGRDAVIKMAIYSAQPHDGSVVNIDLADSENLIIPVGVIDEIMNDKRIEPEAKTQLSRLRKSISAKGFTSIANVMFHLK